MTLSRDTAALFTAVPVAAATVPVSVMIYVALSEGLPNGIALEGAIIYFVVAFLFVVAGGVLIGLPVIWVLRRFSLMNFPVLASAGLLTGGLASWLILSTFPPFVGGIAGLAAAMIWWFIAERRKTSHA